MLSHQLPDEFAFVGSRAAWAKKEDEGKKEMKEMKKMKERIEKERTCIDLRL